MILAWASPFNTDQSWASNIVSYSYTQLWRYTNVILNTFWTLGTRLLYVGTCYTHVKGKLDGRYPYAMCAFLTR